MINKTPDLSKPEYHFNYSKRYNGSVGIDLRSSYNKKEAKKVISQSPLLIHQSEDVAELKELIERLAETVELLDVELDELQQYTEDLEIWGENWNEVAYTIDSYSTYPFVHPPAQCSKFIIKEDQIHSHDLCSYSKSQDLFNDTGLCYAGYDHSIGAVFDVIDEKKWLLSKLKNGY